MSEFPMPEARTYAQGMPSSDLQRGVPGSYAQDTFSAFPTPASLMPEPQHVPGVRFPEPQPTLAVQIPEPQVAPTRVPEPPYDNTLHVPRETLRESTTPTASCSEHSHGGIPYCGRSNGEEIGLDYRHAVLTIPSSASTYAQSYQQAKGRPTPPSATAPAGGREDDQHKSCCCVVM